MPQISARCFLNLGGGGGANLKKKKLLEIGIADAIVKNFSTIINLLKVKKKKLLFLYFFLSYRTDIKQY